MRTPSGRDCSFYYEDFNRGAEIRACRISRPSGAAWREKQCTQCPVPAIELANGSPYLELRLVVKERTVRRTPLFTVEAWCTRHGPIADPYLGCAECAAELEAEMGTGPP